MGTDFESIYGMYRGILSENIYKEGIPAAVIPFILTDISNLRFSQAQNTHDLPRHAVPKRKQSRAPRLIKPSGRNVTVPQKTWNKSANSIENCETIEEEKSQICVFSHTSQRSMLRVFVPVEPAGERGRRGPYLSTFGSYWFLWHWFFQLYKSPSSKRWIRLLPGFCLKK